MSVVAKVEVDSSCDVCDGDETIIEFNVFGSKNKVVVKKAEFETEEARLLTFKDWNVTFVSPNDLAEAGLYSLGDGDRVRCFSCGGGLRNWVDGDIPKIEHEKHFPNCTYVSYLAEKEKEELQIEEEQLELELDRQREEREERNRLEEEEREKALIREKEEKLKRDKEQTERMKERLSEDNFTDGKFYLKKKFGEKESLRRNQRERSKVYCFGASVTNDRVNLLSQLMGEAESDSKEQNQLDSTDRVQLLERKKVESFDIDVAVRLQLREGIFKSAKALWCDNPTVRQYIALIKVMLDRKDDFVEGFNRLLYISAIYVNEMERCGGDSKDNNFLRAALELKFKPLEQRGQTFGKIKARPIDLFNAVMYLKDNKDVVPKEGTEDVAPKAAPSKRLVIEQIAQMFEDSEILLTKTNYSRGDSRATLIRIKTYPGMPDTMTMFDRLVAGGFPRIAAQFRLKGIMLTKISKNGQSTEFAVKINIRKGDAKVSSQNVVAFQDDLAEHCKDMNCSPQLYLIDEKTKSEVPDDYVEFKDGDNGEDRGFYDVVKRTLGLMFDKVDGEEQIQDNVDYFIGTDIPKAKVYISRGLADELNSFDKVIEIFERIVPEMDGSALMVYHDLHRYVWFRVGSDEESLKDEFEKVKEETLMIVAEEKEIVKIEEIKKDKKLSVVEKAKKIVTSKLAKKVIEEKINIDDLVNMTHDELVGDKSLKEESKLIVAVAQKNREVELSEEVNRLKKLVVDYESRLKESEGMVARLALENAQLKELNLSLEEKLHEAMDRYMQLEASVNDRVNAKIEQYKAQSMLGRAFTPQIDVNFLGYISQIVSIQVTEALKNINK